jgi:arsenate reductase (thioredoxin)
VDTHNSSRSQMGEGFLRALAPGRYEVASAGTEKTPVHPLAIRARWDYQITVCDGANERCPFVLGAVTRLHWSFDPSRAAGSEEAWLAMCRRVRDQTKARIAEWLPQHHATTR